MSSNHNEYELSRDIEEIYKTTVQNRQNWKKGINRPVFAEESYPLIKASQNISFDHGESRDVALKRSFLDQKYVSQGGISEQRRRDPNELRHSARRHLINNMNI